MNPKFIVFLATVAFLFAAGTEARPYPPVHQIPGSAFPPASLVQDDIKPLPPLNYVRSRDFDTRHIALDLKFDWESGQTHGSEIFTFSPLRPDFDTLVLDAGLMVFRAVRLKEGEDLEYEYDADKTRLSITLDRKYSVGELVSVEIEYRTTGETVKNTLGFGGGGGLKFVKPSDDEPNKPYQIWSQGESEYNRYWFPSFDYPNDFRTTELKATVRKPLMVISNGKLVETKDNGDDTRTYHWKMDVPYASYLTSIVVGEYAEVRGDYMGIPVSTYVYQNWKQEGEVTARRLPAMVKFFSEKLEFKYPYSKYAQTIANEFNGGMENITATTQTDNMILDSRTELDGDQDGLQAHELAHQWFGNYVTCRDWSEIWLNESFATYMESLWQLESKGKDHFLFNEVRANQNGYFGAWNQGMRRPIVTKHYSSPDSVFDSYAYPRGGAVLHMLRKQLGDENFFRALKHYLKSNANEPVQTEDLRIAIEESTGQSMDAFFDQWLYRMGHPVFEVSKSFDETAGRLTIAVKQVQKRDMTSLFPQVQYFQTPVEIEILTAKGTRIENVFINAKEENVYHFDLDAKPVLVDFDNEGTLIKELTFEKPVDELAYQAVNDTDILGRNWAMSELTKKAGSKAAASETKERVLGVLRERSVSDSTWQLRQSAINNLRTLLSPAAAAPGVPSKPVDLDPATVKTLLAASSDTDSRVRADAIRMLGSTENPVHYKIYLRAANGDRSYGVIDAATFALAKTGNKDAYFVLRKIAQTDSWRNRVQIAGLNGLALLKDKRSLDLGFKFAEDKTSTSGVRNAALRIVSAAGKGDPRTYPLVMDNFKKALAAGGFQTIFTSIEAFINIADPRGQEAFDMLKENFKSSPQFLGFITSQEKRFQDTLKSEQ